MRNFKVVLLTAILVLLLSAFNTSEMAILHIEQQPEWVAPAEADKLVNPFVDNTSVLENGMKIYTAECVVCHGVYGNAKTGIADSLEQKPKDFTKEDFISQSDGAIFWKLSEGRGLMQPFKTMLTEEEIWGVVMYVKQLATKED